MTAEQFRIAIPAMEKIYVVFSTLTHMPYLECNPETMEDEVFLFLQQEAAEATVKTMLERFGKPVLAVEVKNKDMLRLFGKMNMIGVTSLCISDNGEVTHVPLSSLVTERDMSAIPEKQRPVTNKELQTSLLYYLQERRNTQGECADEETIKGLEEELLVNIRRGRYYLLFNTAEDGNLQMLLLNRENAEPMLPVFADYGEMEPFIKNKKMTMMSVTFEQLMELKLPENVQGYLLNPATTSFPMSREYAKQLLILPAGI